MKPSGYRDKERSMGENEGFKLSFNFTFHFCIPLYFDTFLKPYQAVYKLMPLVCSLDYICQSESDTFKINVNCRSCSNYAIPWGSGVWVITEEFGAGTNKMSSNKKEWIRKVIFELYEKRQAIKSTRTTGSFWIGQWIPKIEDWFD